MLSNFAGAAEASVCNAKDRDYAAFWNNAYDPEEAYAFGRKIQALLTAKDLDALFGLVDGELILGPRKRFVATQSFDEVFDADWVKAVLADTPSCQPVGWRGFMLANGRIWFHREQGEWHIFSMNGVAVEAQDESLPIGWRVENELLPFECFYYDSFATDRARELMDQYDISDLDDFLANPGKYIGGKIPLSSNITPSWCKDNTCKNNGFDDKIELVHPLSECRKTADALTILDRLVWRQMGAVSYQYEVIGKLNAMQCQTLAPDLVARCEESYLIAIGDYSGGTIGWLMQYTFYGLFRRDDGARYIVPLKSFDNRNEALNHLEDLG
ncbi:hypothetical protein [Sneathiella sp.]|uniref:hypothetical protein n=1 Tax=Sneathiella sp. TaxID=1964365 RepID=UPI00356711FC